MKNNESFIEERIRWRASQHGLPKKNTYFWESGRKKPSIDFPDFIGRPILVSEGDYLNYMVLGTRGATVVCDGAESSFIYDEIQTVHDLKASSDERKEDLSKLIILLNDGQEIEASIDSGVTAFGVWNILIMLLRMS